jgi:hypothetical protein
MTLVGLDGLLTEEDASEVESTFNSVLRQHNEREASIREGFERLREELLDWSGDLPEHFLF